MPTQSRKLLKMNVLAFETCWVKNKASDISWPIFIQPSKYCSFTYRQCAPPCKLSRLFSCLPTYFHNKPPSHHYCSCFAGRTSKIPISDISNSLNCCVILIAGDACLGMWPRTHIIEYGGPRVEDPLLGVFEISMLRKMFGPKRQSTGYRLPTGWRMYIMNCCLVYIDQTLFGRLKQGRLKWILSLFGRTYWVF